MKLNASIYRLLHGCVVAAILFAAPESFAGLLRYSLKNGIPVFLIQKNNSPLFDMLLAVRTPDGAPLHSKSLEGSVQVNREIEHLGAIKTTSGSQQGIVVALHGLKVDFAELVRLFSTSVLSSKWVNVSHSKNEPDDPFAQALARYLGESTPKKEVKMPDFQSLLLAKNMAIVVVGDFSSSIVLGEFEKWLGHLPKLDRVRNDLYGNINKGQNAIKEGRILVVDNPVQNGSGSSHSLARITFSFLPTEAQDLAKTMLLNTLIGDSPQSRLMSLLREGTVVSVTSQPFLKDRLTISIEAIFLTESVSKVMTEVLAELRAIKSGLLLPEELTAAKDFFRGSYTLAHRNDSSEIEYALEAWIKGEANTLSPKEVLEVVNQASVESLKPFLERAVGIEGVNTVLIGPKATLKKNLEVAGFKAQVVDSLSLR